VNAPQLNLLCGSLLLAALLFLTGCSRSPQQVLSDAESAEKLSKAVRIFSEIQEGKGKPLPEAITLHELVAGGYMATNEVAGFRSMDDKVSLSVETITPLEKVVFIHARMADGSQFASRVWVTAKWLKLE